LREIRRSEATIGQDVNLSDQGKSVEFRDAEECSEPIHQYRMFRSPKRHCLSKPHTLVHDPGEERDLDVAQQPSSRALDSRNLQSQIRCARDAMVVSSYRANRFQIKEHFWQLQKSR